MNRCSYMCPIGEAEVINGRVMRPQSGRGEAQSRSLHLVLKRTL